MTAPRWVITVAVEEPVDVRLDAATLADFNRLRHWVVGQPLLEDLLGRALDLADSEQWVSGGTAVA
jgi:hypothetical protein